MPAIINLTCPTCGGKLRITNEIDRFACGYCGNEHIIQRSGGIVTIEPVVRGIQEVKSGVDRTASELAIRRLEDEVKKLEYERTQILSRKSVWVVFLIIIGGFLLITGFFLIGLAKELWWLILLGSFVIGGGIWHSISNSVRNQRLAAPLNAAIATKKEELERHKLIVQNN